MNCIINTSVAVSILCIFVYLIFVQFIQLQCERMVNNRIINIHVALMLSYNMRFCVVCAVRFRGRRLTFTIIHVYALSYQNSITWYHWILWYFCNKAVLIYVTVPARRFIVVWIMCNLSNWVGFVAIGCESY